MKIKSIGLVAVLACIAPIVSAQELPPAKVRVVKVTEKAAAEQAGLLGMLYFDRVSRISTEVAGQVRQVHFREGDLVSEGEVLININTDFLDKDLALAEAKIEQLKVRVQKNKKNLERYEKLFKREAASEIDYDNLFYAHQELVKEREELESSLSKIKLMRSKCAIQAPFDGIILEKTVDIGDWVIQGRMLYRIGSAGDLFAKVPVSEDLIQFVQKGDKVEVVINAYDTELEGESAGILPVADEKTKNVFLKVRLGNLRDISVPVAENMSATVYVPISEEKNLKIIPRDALVKRQGRDFIYTVKEGKAALLQVTIVSYMGTEVGVNDPYIRPGMSVVVDGNERLKPDQPVEVREEA